MVVHEITSKGEFDSIISKNTDFVIDFFATWCGPCKMISPKLQEMSTEFTNITFYKVDVDEQDEIAQFCEVTAMPTFHFYRGGVKVDELTGASEAKLREKLQALAKPKA